MTTGVEDRIDETLAGIGEQPEPTNGPDNGPDEDDVAQSIDAIRQQLSLVLPAHTFFQGKQTSGGPGPVGIVIGPDGPKLVRGEQKLTGIKARWSAPDGMWRVIAVICPSGTGLVHYEIKGPQTLIRRGDQSVEQLVTKLRDVDAV